MDLKRYTEIGGREALERLSNGLDIFNKYEVQIKIDFEQSDYLWQSPDGEIHSGSEDTEPLNFNELLTGTWYVKKPFDVRAEMLARPNEWVAAFEGDDGKWHKVGFDTKYMRGIETPFLSVKKVDFEQAPVGPLTYEETEKCIPLEDVPKEERS